MSTVDDYLRIRFITDLVASIIGIILYYGLDPQVQNSSWNHWNSTIRDGSQSCELQLLKALEQHSSFSRPASGAAAQATARGQKRPGKA